MWSYDGPVPSKDILNPSPLSSGHIYMKDAHSSEFDEKSYFRSFRFLVFELWLIVFAIYDDTPGVPPTH